MPIALRPHQSRNIEGLLAALKRCGGALDASSTGTGKTFTALGFCKAVNARPIIITRLSIIPSWEEACELVGVRPLFIANYEACKTDSFPYGKVIYKDDPKTGNTSASDFQWNLPEGRFIFIFDEAQSLRNHGSINSKMALAAHRRWKTLLLSATPFQTPLEAKVIGQIIGLFSGNGYWSWLFKHGCRKNYLGFMEFIGDVKDPRNQKQGTNARKGQEIMAKLNRDIFPLHGVKTLHDEIPGFPRTLLLAEAIETGEADAITREYQAELAALREADHARACEEVDPDLHDYVEVLPMVRDLRHRQEVEALKCRSMADMAKLAHEHGDSVALFVNFDKSVDLLSHYLNCPWIIRGNGHSNAMNNYDRVNVVQAFQQNRTPYVIVNSAAGGAGLSLHDPITQLARTTLISPPSSAVLLKQVIGRCHRDSGGYSTQKILFAANTIEERAMRRVRNRLGNLDSLLDSDLEVTE